MLTFLIKNVTDLKYVFTWAVAAATPSFVPISIELMIDLIS